MESVRQPGRWAAFGIAISCGPWPTISCTALRLAGAAAPAQRRQQRTADAVAQIVALRKAMNGPVGIAGSSAIVVARYAPGVAPAVMAQLPAGCDQLVFVTVAAAHTVPNVVGTHASWTHKPGGDLCLLSGLGSGRVLVRGIIGGHLGPGHVHGLDLSFDGNRLVFAWARQDGWPRHSGCKVDTMGYPAHPATG